MTINLADNDPRDSYTVVNGNSQTVFTMSFEIFDDEDLNVYVDGTLQTLTTDYKVSDSASDANAGHTSGTTGHVHFTSAVTASGSDKIVVLTRDIEHKRTTDFPASGAFQINSLNTELDKLIAIAADLDDEVNRSLRLTDYDTSVSLVLPDVNSRKGTVLAFDSTTGAVVAGPQTGNVNTIAAISTDIATLADIEDGTVATDAISDLAAIASDVSTVSGIASNVTTVAGNTTNINTVAADLSGSDDIGTVATNIANVNTVAGINSNVTTVAGISANVTTVAGDSSDIQSLAAVSTEIGLLGTADAISDMNLLATSAIITDMDALADLTAEIDALGDVTADVTTVAGIQANVTTVAGISANVTTVAGISSNVTTVAGISADVTTVAADGTDIGTVATNISNVNTVAGNNANINTVAGISSNVTTVAGISADVTAVAGDATDIGTVATDLTGSNNIGTVAGAISNVNAVGADIANVNTTAANIAGVNSFAERYRVGASDPTTSLDEGDLAYNSTDNALKYYDGTSWSSITAGLTDIVADVTPQLGGNLDLNSNDITGTGNIDITGTVTADGLTVDGNKVGISNAAPASVRASDTIINMQDSFVTVGATNINLSHNVFHNGTNWVRSTTDSVGHLQVANNQLNFFNSTSDTAGTTVSFTKRMNINGGGDISFYDTTGTTQGLFWDASTQRLGLGSTTPVQKLDVYGGNIAVSSADTYQTAVNIDNTDTGGRHFGLHSTGSNSTAGRFRIYDYDANVERMTITSGGSVGIGTASPSGKLTVIGSLSNGQIVAAQTSSNSADKYGSYTTLHYNTAEENFNFISGVSGTTDNRIFVGGGLGEYNAATNIQFYTAANNTTTTGSERMRIDSSGNVGIAKTNPSTALDVSGTVTATSFAGDGSNLTGVAAGATGGGSDEIFYENGQTVTTNYTITNGKNAMSAGPISINTGVTVTVGAGETWTVV